MPNSEHCLEFLTERSARSVPISEWEEWGELKYTGTAQWLYIFSPVICAWGTTSARSDRPRKTSLFHEKLTGKYDRRLDYLLLKRIHGLPAFWVFEPTALEETVQVEHALKQGLGGQRHFFTGFGHIDRSDISRQIMVDFKNTAHWINLSEETKDYFNQYLNEVYYCFREHPNNPRRKFHFGDSLEPGFLKLCFPDEMPKRSSRPLKKC